MTANVGMSQGSSGSMCGVATGRGGLRAARRAG